MCAENSSACSAPMVADPNKTVSSITFFTGTTSKLSPPTYGSDQGDPKEVPARTCEMQYKQITNKLDLRQQINSADSQGRLYSPEQANGVMAGDF